jgi:hypothetical protein
MRSIYLIANENAANTAIETWFVQNVMLPGLPLDFEATSERVTNSVVIHLEIGKPKIDMIRSLVSRNNKVVLYHMADEVGALYDRSAYLTCDLVLRNYYDARIFGDREVGAKTMWVPNGFKSGVGPRRPETLRRATQRRFPACFIGWINNPHAVGNERSHFADIARQHPGEILLRQSDGFGRGFATGLYSMAMEHSIFAPCPAGNSAETIRLYDALELGCIPVSLRHPFLSAPAALAYPPFPVLDRWDEFPAFMQRMRALQATRPAELDALQAACIDWWDVRKRDIAARISRSLHDLRRS